MKLTDKQQTAINELNKAEEKFLLDIGWVKDGKHFSSPVRIGYVFPGDKVFVASALEATKSYFDLNQ